MSEQHRGNNATSRENELPGNSEWLLESPATNGGLARLRREIEGYASATSVAAGETIRFFIHTDEPTYRLAIYRVGWYGGLGGRRVWPDQGPDVEQPGISQPIPNVPESGLSGCNWTPTDELTIPSDWVSGVYLESVRKMNYP